MALDEAQRRQAEALRVTLLLAALVVLFGLVLVLRAAITKREALIKNQDVFDYQTGLLTRSELGPGARPPSCRGRSATRGRCRS